MIHERRKISVIPISIALIAILLMGQTAWATTYYVDRLLPGSDSNSGVSESTPYLTVSKCASMLVNPGDQCLVKNGTYPENVRISHSGTAANPIALKNYPGHSPLLDFKNVDYNGLYIVASPSPTLISYVTVQGLRITRGSQGIKVEAGENLVFQGNEIYNNVAPLPNGGTGIVCVFCHHITITQNRIHDNGRDTAPYGHGIYLYGSDHIVTNNLIYGNGGFGLQAAGRPCVDGQYTNVNQCAASNWFVANNTFSYGRNRGGMTIWNSNNTGANNHTIVNNIFLENAQQTSSSNGIEFCNSSSGHNITNNLSYATSPGGTAFIGGGCSGTEVCTSCTITNNSVNIANPNMVNAPSTEPASPDFHLTSKSAGVIDFGLNLTANRVTNDLDGKPRPVGNGFDIGAYEFSTDAATLVPHPPTNLSVIQAAQ